MPVVTPAVVRQAGTQLPYYMIIRLSVPSVPISTIGSLIAFFLVLILELIPRISTKSDSKIPAINPRYKKKEREKAGSRDLADGSHPPIDRLRLF